MARPTSPIVQAIDTLDRDFDVYWSRRAPPAPRLLEALEIELGRPLHPQHRQLIAEVGSVALIARKDVWPRPHAFESRPFWQTVWGFEVFGLAAVGHPLSLVRRRSDLESKVGGQGLLPVASLLGAARRLCLTEDGNLVWWTRTSVEPATDFDTELVALIEQLRLGKERMKGESPTVTERLPQRQEPADHRS